MPYSTSDCIFGPAFWQNPWQPAQPGGVIPVANGQQIQFIQYANVQGQAAIPAPPEVPDEEGDMINDFKVGCDPEFILLDGQKKTYPASHILPHDGAIGYDHGGRIAEFRPGPSKGITPIIRKIQELVKDKRISNGLYMRSGASCNDECLGGHVHFGFNCFQTKPAPNTSILRGGVFNDKGAKVTKALDALTKALEHLDILPREESTKRRNSAQAAMTDYGAFGDVRDCHGHMEYRTMASWLYDPRIAYLVLTAAKLAAADPVGSYEALRTCDSFSKLKRWLESYENKDVNAKRTSEKLLDKGLRNLQIDPTVDFRERWRELGI